MLTILGKDSGQSSHFCDGLSRRTFLQIGGLAMGGLSIPQLLRAESDAGKRRSHKAIIMIFLPGGPPHQDMFDLKPDAPSEIRGEFQPIKTNVRGIEICEHFPLMAKMMDKFTVIRSLVGAFPGHTSYHCLVGRPFENQPPGGWPCLGAVISHLQGEVAPAFPAGFALAPKFRGVFLRWGYNGEGGFLGPGHAPFTPADPNVKNDLLLEGITLDRLRDRKALLNSFDQFRRKTDRSGVMESLDTYQQQAFGILTSNKLAEALDLNKEDPKLRDRYGRGSAELVGPAVAPGGPALLDQFLLARRLVEAGARCVTLAFNRWDWHGNIFPQAREAIPMLDQGVSALVQDLHDRGLDEDVSVIVWGEFGRTPKINKNAGRHHWTNVSCALLAGGGMRTGQVIGSTDRNAAEVKDRPVHFQDVFATLYHNMGIDAQTTTITDLDGRPHFLVDPAHKPIEELI